MVDKKKLIEKRYTSRRQFLYGCGTSFVLPPLLSLMPTKALAQTASGGVQRLILLCESFGMRYVDINPSPASQGLTMRNSGHSFIKELNLSEFSNPISYMIDDKFNDLLDYVNVYENLSLLTDAGHSGSLFNGSGGSRDPHYGRTIDNVIRTSDTFKNSFTGSVDVIRPSSSYYFHDRVFDQKTGLLQFGEGTKITNPSFKTDQDVFDALFQSKVPVKDPSEIAKAQRKVLLVDKLLVDYKNLKNHRRLSSQDKSTLDQVYDGLFEAQNNIKSPNSGAEDCSIPTLSFAPQDKNGNIRDHVLKYENIFKMVPLAFMCDQSRMVTQYLTDGNHNHHQLDDRADVQYGSMGQRDRFQKYLLPLINTLKATNDPYNSGNMLDNSLIVWVNEHGNRSHKHHSIPIFTVGKLGGSLLTGKFLDFNVPSGEIPGFRYSRGHPLKMLMVSIMRGMGLTQEEVDKNGYGNGFGVATVDKEWFPHNQDDHMLPLKYLYKGS